MSNAVAVVEAAGISMAVLTGRDKAKERKVILAAWR